MKLFTAYTAIIITVLLSQIAFANVVGPDPENFNPTTDGLDFVTVQSSETLETGIFNFGAFLDYAVNSLPHFDNLVNYNRLTLNDFLLFGHLNAGMGLAKNWDIGLSLPYLLNDYVRDSNYSGIFFSTGLMSVEANTKYRFWGDNNHGFAAIVSANFNTLINNPFTGTNAGPVLDLEAAYDDTFGKWAAAVNVGYRFRQPGTAIPGVPVEPYKNQIIGSLAGSYLFTQWDTKLILELFGSYPTQSSATSSDRSVSSLEALLGMKHDLSQNIAVHAGIGTGLINGTASPSWRLYAGLNWALGSTPPPPAIVPVTKENQVRTYQISSDVIFAFDSDKIFPAGEKYLEEFAKDLSAPPVFKTLEIVGHTDSIGSVQYNMDLSLRRANSAKKVLVEKYHLDSKKITAVGMGPNKPIADNGNYQGRQKNRRVEFNVTR